MKKEKRYLCDRLDTIIAKHAKMAISAPLILSVVIAIGFTFFFCKYSPSFINDDWETSYDEVNERYHFLEQIAEDTIIRGVTIDIRNIPNDVKYQITPDMDNNIVYYYVLPSSDTYSSDYEMTIILSKDMDILSKDCSITLSSAEKYQRDYMISYYLSIVLYSIKLSMGILFFLLLFLVLAYFLSKYYRPEE